MLKNDFGVRFDIYVSEETEGQYEVDKEFRRVLSENTKELNYMILKNPEWVAKELMCLIKESFDNEQTDYKFYADKVTNLIERHKEL